MIGEFWDEMFAGDEYRYGTAPNRFVREREHIFPVGGRILCIGDGEGRNGVWLAKRGYRVTTIDPSSVGVEKAKRLAEAAGVKVDARVGTWPDCGYDRGTWDGIVLVYVHMLPELRAEAHRAVVDALAPGGLVLLEGFAPRQLQFKSGGPTNPEMLYTVDMLRGDFADLDEEAALELDTWLDEGPGHHSEGAIVRFIASKPFQDEDERGRRR